MERRMLMVGLLAALIASGPATASAAEGDAARAAATAPESAAARAAAVELAEERLEMAREEEGFPRVPDRYHALGAGSLVVETTETVASQPGQELVFAVVLDEAVDRGTLRLTLPRIWLETASSGLRYAEPPRLAAGAPQGTTVTRAGDTVALTVRDGAVGDRAAIVVRDIGIPAGDYRLPFAWEGQGGERSGAATVRIFAPVREGEGSKNPFFRINPNTGFETNATEPGDACATPAFCEANAQGGDEEQSETYIGVSPYDTDRILVQSNNIDEFAESAFLSVNGGRSFKRLKIPNDFDAPGEAAVEKGAFCCDPMSAEDNLGNIWYGGLTSAAGAGAPSRIVVNRIAAGETSFQPRTVGLPLPDDGGAADDAGQQDKNMMTIDNSPTSPTYGRLYVVWNDTGGGNAVVISNCDTRPGGISNPAWCDEADHWTVPVVVAPRGSLIYADAAVGPEGIVYVTWWDFSSQNAIRGRFCDARTADCSKAESFGAIEDIARLNDDRTGLDDDAGAPLPFACPIPAQPGGRVGPSPGVDTDISNGPNRGRVYVSWGDLRSGPSSGLTRCEEAGPGGTPPSPTVLSWDSFITSGPAGGLPGRLEPSADVATRLYTDGSGELDDKGEAGQANSDEWFPWLVVDPSTGQAYADFYSTRHDTTRRRAHFYTRSVTPKADAPGGHELGTLTRSSVQDSDYSAGTTGCCIFGNDYGDYTGLDAGEGFVFPVWTRRAGAGDDGDAYTVVPKDNPQLELEEARAGEGAGADQDGFVEPGEPVRLFVRVRNPSEVGVTNVAGTLASLTPKATVTQPRSPYPNVPAGGGRGENTTAFEARLATDIACTPAAPAPIDFRVDLATDQGPESVAFTIPVCGRATAPGVPFVQDRPSSPPGAAPPTPPGPIACAAASGFRRAAVAPRGGRLGLSFSRFANAGPVTVDVFQQSVGRRVIGERLVARFNRRSRSFTWNGRANRRGRRVGDGYYFVRFTSSVAAGKDVRRLVLRRVRGRFSARPSHERREGCAAIGTFKLTRPVFGGPRNRELGIAYRLRRNAEAEVQVLRGSRVVKRFPRRAVTAGRLVRLRFDSEGLARGDYRVRLVLRGAGPRPVTASLTSRRL